MATGLGGLNSLGSIRGFLNNNPEATPEEVHGGPVDEFHGHSGEVADPSGWVAYGGAWGDHPIGPIGPENELLGDPPENGTFRAGNLNQDPTGDETPYRTHAGPFPRGRETSIDPDATSRQLVQNARLRSVNTGAELSRQYRPTMFAQQDHWKVLQQNRRGSTLLDPALPRQMQGAIAGAGNRDSEISMAQQNVYDFNTAHQRRRYATGSIPGNYLWMRPGGRPMVKTLAGPARPANGPGPFQGQDIGQSFRYDTGAVLQDPGAQYTPPPVPYVAPAIPSQDAAPGEDWF
jgi:hypothetical protein